jgi:hypothetical protein
MATLIVYPDAADITLSETNHIKELTFADYLDAHVPNWDRGLNGHKLKAPRFVATLNKAAFSPKRWREAVLLETDLVEVVIPPKGLDPISWVVIAIAVISAAYSYYVMNQMNQMGSSSSTVPTGNNIYDINVQANSAELMGIRPQWFGRHKVVPSYLCAPFKYYDDDNQQCVCVMLHIGEGEYQISSTDITIAGTPINNLGDDATWTLFGPSEDVSSHEAHKHIYTAEEVGGTDSSSGLDFIGPSDVVAVNSGDGIVITLSGSTILYQKNGSTVNFSWDDGTTFTLTGTSSSSVVFDGLVEIVDGGNDETSGDLLPDKIVGSGLSSLSVGSSYQLSGAGSTNDGVYVIATNTGSEVTMKDTSGNDVTWLAEGVSVPVKFIRTNTDDGSYEVQSTDSSKRLVVSRVGDTSWSSFNGGSYSSGVSLEVTSDSLPDYQLGPYTACPAGYTTNYIEVDMLRSSGWGHYNDDGTLESITVEWEIWVRDADLGDADAWQVFPQSYTGADYDQKGTTHKLTLNSAKRPEVMLVRKTKSYDDSKYLDKLQWMRLKAKLPTATSYAKSTTLALSIRSDSSLSASATKKIKVLQTRKLPIPDGNGGWTSENYATRGVAPAIRYVVHNSGGSDDDIDMDALLYLHENVFSPRGEYFDGGFTDDSTVYDVLKTMLQAAMAEFCFDVGKILPKRLFEKTTPGYVYTPDVMTGKGLTVTTTLYDPNQNEGLVVYYMDPTDWTTGSVKCWLGDKNSITKWGELELTKGVTSKTRAWRIGMRSLRRSQSETVNYKFTTEMDALNSNYLDYAELCDDLPNFGQFGEIVDWQNVVNDSGDTVAQLTLDRELEWSDGEVHYMVVRRHDGTGSGPFVVTKVDDDVVMLDAMLDFIPDLSGRIEPPLWLFGDANRYSETAIIKSIQPSTDNDKTSCTVTAVNYSSDIFKDDDNEPPADTVTWWE